MPRCKSESAVVNDVCASFFVLKPRRRSWRRLPVSVGTSMTYPHVPFSAREIDPPALMTSCPS